jgi:CheY-like chemotaxis protein
VYANLSRFGLGVGVCLAGLALALGQDQPAPPKEGKAAKKGEQPPPAAEPFYKKPQSLADFWKYMNHEIALGDYKLALSYLKGFQAELDKLDKDAGDKELLQIYDREGTSAFSRLLTIQELRKDAAPLVQQADDVVQRFLSNRARLDKLINLLTQSREERAYAIAQLKRSGAAAVPAIIDALIRTTDDLDDHQAILSVLPLLDKAGPPIIAALDMPDANIRAELIGVLRQRNELAAVPFLWYYAASPRQPGIVRSQATEALAAFLETRPDQLPPAKVALTQEAERYYQHHALRATDQPVLVWRWDGQHVIAQPLPVSQAEEYYGLWFGGEALDLDPAYAPAQIIFLSLALDKGVERAGLDQPLSRGAPAVQELVASANPELVMAVLEKGLQDHRLGVIVAATRDLGDVAAMRAARTTERGSPVLVQALNYPERRVQLAAADALLRIPVASPPAPARVVEVLRRTLAADAVPRVLVADFDKERLEQLGNAVRQAGFEPVLVRTGRQALARLQEAADIDAVLIDADIPDPMIPYLLAQLRSDVYSGLLPVFVLAHGNRAGTLEGQVERYRNVWVVPATTAPGGVKDWLTRRLVEATGRPLTEAERKDNAARALEWLARIGRGEVTGYDIRPAAPAILDALRSKDLVNLAVEAAGRLPGPSAQMALARVVLENQPPELRSKSAIELCRHIELHGNHLSTNQVKALENLYNTLADSPLKAHVGLVIGSLHPNPQQTGERLLRYQPSFAAPAPAKKKEEKKEDTDSGKD